MTQSHTDIINQWPSIAAFAQDVGVGYRVAQSWKHRDSIPASHFVRVLNAAANRGVAVTLEQLVAAVKGRGQDAA